MKSYQHHIRDFNNATRHLNRIERSIYRDMIELYYDTEEPLPLDFDLLCRKVMARSNEESTIVKQLLNEFFIETSSGWWHEVCDEVILQYQGHQSQKSAAGKASAEKRANRKKQMLSGCSTTVATSVQTNVEQASNKKATKPETRNHKPETNNQKPARAEKAEKRNALSALAKKPVDNFLVDDTWLEVLKKLRPDLINQAEEIRWRFKIFWDEQGALRDDWPTQWEKWVLNERGD